MDCVVWTGWIFRIGWWRCRIDSSGRRRRCFICQKARRTRHGRRFCHVRHWRGRISCAGQTSWHYRISLHRTLSVNDSRSPTGESKNAPFGPIVTKFSFNTIRVLYSWLGVESVYGSSHVRDSSAVDSAIAANAALAATDDHVRHAQGLYPPARIALRGPSGAHPRVSRRTR